jgi:hypothetical protein
MSTLISHIVANRHDIQPETARRTMSSLQSYADNVEYIDGAEQTSKVLQAAGTYHRDGSPT